MKSKLFGIRLGMMVALLALASQGFSQAGKKYQSLFWEITGNGLQKPSYLYGSMHVSNKVAFHLSDPFFVALKNCDMIALEENPEDFVKIYDYYYELSASVGDDGDNYYRYGSDAEEGFYADAFRLNALTRSKIMNYLMVDNQYINQLLYRYQSYSNGNEQGDYSDNFAESTYLDLFVFQSAKKNNKLVINLENYKKTIELQIKGAMPDEDKKKNNYSDDYGDYFNQNNAYDMIEDAYLRGDLDLIDSLSLKMNPSKNFRKYFINERNSIMANRMDSIMKAGTALFTTVGSAHLPGEAGVIELLRSKGYTVKPISKILISKKSSELKKIEDKKVKRNYEAWMPADSSFEVSVPGSMSLFHSQSQNRFYIYPDMANGAFYFISRIPTMQFLANHSSDFVLSQVDSALYQGIPGEIIVKKDIVKNGVKGFDIVNKTKRGDFQRYQIFVTPVELVIFKMGGIRNYVKDESDAFFNSIRFKKGVGMKTIGSAEKGYTLKIKDGYTLCENVISGYKNTRTDQIVQAVDSLNYYLMMRTSYHDYDYIEEDNFELGMLAYHFLKDRGYKTVDSTVETIDKKPALTMKLKNDKNEFLSLKIMIAGPFYYLLASISNNQQAATGFFNSFKLEGNLYPDWAKYKDTSMYFRADLPDASIPKVPDLTNVYKNLYNSYGSSNKSKAYESKEITKTFRFAPTDEAINVTFYRYAKYTHFKNEDDLWEKIVGGNNDSDEDFSSFFYSNSHKKFGKYLGPDLKPGTRIVHKKASTNGINKVMEYTMVDSLSTRGIKTKHVLHHGVLYTLTTCIDTTKGMSEFEKRFFDTFTPADTLIGTDVFVDKNQLLFSNLNSTDTTMVREALECINDLKFEAKDLPQLSQTLKTFNFKKWGHNYKIDLIDGCDIADNDSVLSILKNIYNSAGDTSSLKFAALETLADIQTQKSYELITNLLQGDIPFDNSDGIDDLFSSANDSLKLAKTLFPTLLNLTRYEDYREDVYELLSDLVDSSLIKPEVYQSHIKEIISDGNNELKRTISEENDFTESSYDSYKYNSYSGGDNSSLYKYASILMPFYTDPQVKTFIDKTLNTKSDDLIINLSILLLKNNKEVNDTIWEHFAKNPEYSHTLYESLKSIGKESKFPKAYLNQEFFAKSLLTNTDYNSKTDTIVFLCKKLIKQDKKSGYLYFFKYKDKDKDEKKWKMAYCGLQPSDTNKVDGEYPDYSKVVKESLPIEQTKLDEKINDVLRTIELKKRKRAGNSYSYDYDY